MRLAIGSIRHRTNTFSAVPTTLPAFESCRLFIGEEVVHQLQGTSTSLGTLIEASRAADIDLLPTIAAEARPGGMIATGVIEDLCNRLCERLTSAPERADALLLELSGTTVAKDRPDADAYIVARARRALGDQTPIIVAVDSEANPSPRVVDVATIVTTTPECQARPVAAARRILEQLIAATSAETHPVCRLCQLPLLIPLTTGRSEGGPLFGIIELADRHRHEQNVIDVSLCTGFPYADTPRTGASVMVTTDGDETLAQRIADNLAEQIWARRKSLNDVGLLLNSETAVHDAMAAASGTFLLLETGDDPAAGGPGDATGLLWALLDLGAHDAAFASIADPTAVALAVEAGIGQRLSLRLGAWTDRRHGYPIDVEARVARISDGRVARDHSSKRTQAIELGRTVVLEAEGRHGGDVQIIVSERAAPFNDAAIFRAHGIEPSTKRILAVKGSSAAEVGLADVAGHVALVATPGITTPQFEFFDFEHLRRPIYPLDRD